MRAATLIVAGLIMVGTGTIFEKKRMDREFAESGWKIIPKSGVKTHPITDISDPQLEAIAAVIRDGYAVQPGVGCCVMKGNVKKNCDCEQCECKNCDCNAVAKDITARKIICREFVVEDASGKAGVTIRAEAGGSAIYIGGHSGPLVTIYQDGRQAAVCVWGEAGKSNTLPFGIAAAKEKSAGPWLQIVDKNGKVRMVPATDLIPRE